MLNGIFDKKLNKNWLEEISKDVEYTHDAPELARCECHHLCVIDDLQRGRKYHHILSNGKATRVATAFTEAQFHCWKRIPDPVEPPYPENNGPAYEITSIPEEVFTTRGKEKVSLGFTYSISLPKKPKIFPTSPPIRVEETLVIPLPKKDQ